MNNEILQFNNSTYQLKRYPKTTDNSLRAWSNAELLALDYLKERSIEKIHLYNDRFGIWNVLLNDTPLVTVSTYASQKKAIIQNLRLNNLSIELHFVTPLEHLKQVEIALVKIPKSLDLFELFLQQIHKASTQNTEVIGCFMTKYFSATALKIASQYFEVVEQSKAWKKARLLILKQPKIIHNYKELINTISFNNTVFKQYYGVFSSDKIDIGTQFLLEHLQVDEKEKTILDLASGNGVIAHQIQVQNSNAKVTLVDDFNLAIESSKLNMLNKANFICDNNLSQCQENTFDLVVSNPPFHFEHENNIEVSLSLFKEVHNILKPNGRFVLVANRHLNYKTHLSQIFDSVDILSENNRFIIYECY